MTANRTTAEGLGLLRRFTRWCVRRYYGHIEVSGRERIPATGPLLVCANHANSLIDPVVLGIAAGRPLRFMAKAPLFEVPVLGPILESVGMVPAYRGSDDQSQVRRNFDSLDAAAAVLVAGEAMGIFPEGKSTDPEHLEKVRSGAARIALQAVASGAAGLQVLPIGITYERKDRSGSDIWVRVAEPIDVAAWLQQHDGDAKVARRSLTAEIERRLREVVVHLDDADAEPWLRDLEVLAPPPPGGLRGRVAPLHQRKRIADAINHFLAADPERAGAMGAQIAAYRAHVHDAGLRVDAPLLRMRGPMLALRLAARHLWMALVSVPALVGTLHHIFPFVAIRTIAALLPHPGRMTIATSRLMLSVPVYGLWYGAIAWWMFGYYTTWFTVVWLALMPFAGVIAMGYWRRAALSLRELRQTLMLGFRRARLAALRAEAAALRTALEGFAEEYARVAPEAAAAPPVSRRRKIAGITVAGGAILLLTALALTIWYLPRGNVLGGPGLDLAALPEARLRAHLARDRKTLDEVLAGATRLEADAVRLQGEFAVGTRSYVTQGDNDAVRELLRRYLTYRTVLFRLVWRYQRHADLAAPALRHEAFLLNFTAASLLYESGLKFVHQFDRSAETVAKFNEPEPNWGIPPRLYDTIRRNLGAPAHRRMLEAAHGYYRAHQAQFAALGLRGAQPYDRFHAAVERAEGVIAKLDQPLDRFAVAAGDAAGLVNRLRYTTQSAISTWIGDAKIRKPRGGRSLISTAHLQRLAGQLQPGDILLERRNWYLSNAFLPGYWPHGAVYVGNTADLQALGLHTHPQVQPHWARFAAPDPEGHAHVIIEAISEGVVFSTLEHSIGAADAVAVFRPKVTPEQRREAIARAFSFAGRPYDFEFDFSSTDKLVCTEVVYRTYGGNSGPISFPVVEIMGRPTMPAINLVQKYKDERDAGTPQLEFIGFIDGDEVTGRSRYITDADELIQTLDRAGLTWLQGLERGSLRGLRTIGPLGWVLLVLTLLALVWAGWARVLEQRRLRR